MNKNLTSNQLLLFGMAGVVLLIAAFSLILLQDPSAPLPFAPPPATSTFTLPPPTETPLPTYTDTTIPTRQTSYTPFAITYTPSSGTPSTGTPDTATPTGSTPVPTTSPTNTTSTPGPSKTNTPRGATGSQYPTGSATSTQKPSTPGTVTPTHTPSQTPSQTVTPTPTSTYSGSSPTPTLTPTLIQGQIGVTGRVTLNGTPMANVIVSFEDDTSPRQSTTDQGGHYWFTTLAPGIPFILTFDQRDNPQLNPALDFTSLAKVSGTLPSNINLIDLPDFDISLLQNSTLFELQIPLDGSAYSASNIGSNNKIEFVWTLYGLGGSYHVELGPNGSDEPIWSSEQLALTYIFWDGTLDNGSHITEGTYWWRVAVTKSLGNYVEVIYTQPWDLFFNP